MPKDDHFKQLKAQLHEHGLYVRMKNGRVEVAQRSVGHTIRKPRDLKFTVEKAPGGSPSRGPGAGYNLRDKTHMSNADYWLLYLHRFIPKNEHQQHSNSGDARQISVSKARASWWMTCDRDDRSTGKGISRVQKKQMCHARLVAGDTNYETWHARGVGNGHEEKTDMGTRQRLPRVGHGRRPVLVGECDRGGCEGAAVAKVGVVADGVKFGLVVVVKRKIGRGGATSNRDRVLGRPALPHSTQHRRLPRLHSPTNTRRPPRPSLEAVHDQPRLDCSWLLYTAIEYPGCYIHKTHFADAPGGSPSRGPGAGYNLRDKTHMSNADYWLLYISLNLLTISVQDTCKTIIDCTPSIDKTRSIKKQPDDTAVDHCIDQLLEVFPELHAYDQYGRWAPRAFFQVILRTKSGKARSNMKDAADDAAAHAGG
ncbi:hypothetical protein BDV93DRAFT_516070 [Ceratobasidium sp. AG-I]|nr:hypothetical protein BDV93DRAFT_516070 [Ceratobasidium sp. AG-I]